MQGKLDQGMDRHNEFDKRPTVHLAHFVGMLCTVTTVEQHSLGEQQMGQRHSIIGVDAKGNLN